MTRNELKEVITRIIEKMSETKECTPTPSCVFGDSTCKMQDSCDITTYYAVGEEG